MRIIDVIMHEGLSVSYPAGSVALQGATQAARDWIVWVSEKWGQLTGDLLVLTIDEATQAIEAMPEEFIAI